MENRYAGGVDYRFEINILREVYVMRWHWTSLSVVPDTE